MNRRKKIIWNVCQGCEAIFDIDWLSCPRQCPNASSDHFKRKLSIHQIMKDSKLRDNVYTRNVDWFFLPSSRKWHKFLRFLQKISCTFTRRQEKDNRDYLERALFGD